MMERLMALVLAGTLVAPQIGMASESELSNHGTRNNASKFPETLPLPPIQYLDTMPWINFGSASNGQGIDALLLRDFMAPSIPKNSAVANSDAPTAVPWLDMTTAAK